MTLATITRVSTLPLAVEMLVDGAEVVREVHVYREPQDGCLRAYGPADQQILAVTDFDLESPTDFIRFSMEIPVHCSAEIDIEITCRSPAMCTEPVLRSPLARARRHGRRHQSPRPQVAAKRGGSSSLDEPLLPPVFSHLNTASRN